MLEQNILLGRAGRKFPHVIAFMGGGLLMFSWTSLSPIDVLAMFVGLVTILDVIHKKDIVWALQKRNLVLLSFGTLVLFQLFLYPLQNPVPALITSYLIGACLCIQYWVRKYPDALSALVYGYVFGAILYSLLGFTAYLVRIGTEGRVILPLFWGSDVRLAGFFDDPNIYGAYLIPAVAILFWFSLMRTWMIPASVALYSALFLVYINVLLSGSRGAWLNMAVVLMVVVIAFYGEFLARFRKLLVLGVVSLSIAIVVIFILPIHDEATFFDYSLATRKESSDAPRFRNLQAAPGQILDRTATEIVIGSGTESYQEDSPSGLAAHNTYLTILYEQGVVGLILLLLYMITPFKTLLSQPRNVATVLLVALLLGILVEGIYIDILHWRHLWVLLAFI